MPRKVKERVYKPHKVNYVNSVKAACAEYKRVLLVKADNVGSKQIAKIRIKIRAMGAILIMGKNTLMKVAIRKAIADNAKLKEIIPLIQGNCGLIFTNGNLKELKKAVEEEKKQSPAKDGSIANSHVIIPAQNTGMEPTKTSFFQALDIPTKITRGTVEIVNDTPLLKPGDVVNASQAQLLQLLRIFPFEYGLKVYSVYDDGQVYDGEVLDLTDEDLLNGFFTATSELAAFSLQLGRVNEATVPHSLANSFKDLLSVAVETPYKFKQAETVVAFLKDPSKFVKQEAKTEDKKEEKQEEEEEEEEEDAPMGGGLFEEEEEDDDDEDSDDE